MPSRIGPVSLYMKLYELIMKCMRSLKMVHYKKYTVYMIASIYGLLPVNTMTLMKQFILGTGHKVSTTPGWRVAPDFFKKFNTPHKRKGTILSPIQILLKYFVPHILY
jgi:hypothetical protein